MNTKRLLLPLLLCLLLIPTTANAGGGLLSRLFSGPQSGCPGGVCPTNAQWTNNDGLSARQHVEKVHGVNTSGMSASDIQQHQNEYHNTYGSGHPVRGVVNAVVSVPRAGVRAVANAVYGPPPTSSSYGSHGSQSYGSSGGDSLAVGKMYKGELVVSVSPPTAIPEVASDSTVAKGFNDLRARRTFKRNVLEAAKQKVEDGTLSQEKYNQLNFALKIPRIAREMEDAMKTQAVDDGLIAGPLQDIDWEKLMEFIVKWLPTILDLFTAEELQINAAPYVSTQPQRQPEYIDWFTAA